MESTEIIGSGSSSRSLFEQIGGRPVIEKVHKVFYDKVYDHPWLKQFFEAVDQKHIEDQQTDFMIANMGGPRLYCGRLPIPTHLHMNITEELFDLRHAMLADSIKEVGIPEEYAQRWLIMDNAFRKRLVKNTLDDCKKRYATDVIMDFKDPSK